MELLKESAGALGSHKVEVAFSHRSDPHAVNRESISVSRHVRACVPACLCASECLLTQNSPNSWQLGVRLMAEAKQERLRLQHVHVRACVRIYLQQ